jgi:hypothetical protein
MKKKSIAQRLSEWFGSEAKQKKAKQEYEKGEAKKLWEEIPEEKRGIMYHSFQNILSTIWKKTEKGGARPRSGQKKKN